MNRFAYARKPLSRPSPTVASRISPVKGDLVTKRGEESHEQRAPKTPHSTILSPKMPNLPEKIDRANTQ